MLLLARTLLWSRAGVRLYSATAPPVGSPLVDTLLADAPPVDAQSGPSPSDFLKKIGRNCCDVAPKFASLEALLGADGRQMARMGIPVRQRRYILRWTEAFRAGMPLYEIPLPDKKDKSKSKSKSKNKKK